jgi:hypothetical protein
MRSGREVSRLLDDTSGGQQPRPGDYRSAQAIGWLAILLIALAAALEVAVGLQVVQFNPLQAAGAEGLAAVAFLAWVRRAYANLRPLGAQVLRDTPISAVTWFLVPVFGWVLPYLVMRDLWKLSDSSDPHGLNEARSNLVLAWWVLWVGPGLAVLAVIFLRPTFEVGPAGLAILVSMFIAARVVAAALASAVILNITARQQASHRALLAQMEDGGI